MIIDLISNIEQYKALGERMSKAIDFIKSTDFKTLETGKHAVDGNEIFVAVSEYCTKPEAEAKPEAHKKYIDIQMVIEGAELMGYLPIEGQETSTTYNPEKDVEFYALKTNLIKIEPGMFAVFFPQDIHQPGVLLNGAEKVRKVVVKVLV